MHWLLVTTQKNERKVRKSLRKRRKTCVTIIVGNRTRNLSIGNRCTYHFTRWDTCTHAHTHTQTLTHTHTHTHTHTRARAYTNYYDAHIHGVKAEWLLRLELIKQWPGQFRMISNMTLIFNFMFPLRSM